jgi:hypothetical protein
MLHSVKLASREAGVNPAAAYRAPREPCVRFLLAMPRSPRCPFGVRESLRGLLRSWIFGFSICSDVNLNKS